MEKVNFDALSDISYHVTALQLMESIFNFHHGVSIVVELYF